MGGIAEALGRFLSPILVPIIKQAIKEYVEETAVVGKRNVDLERLWEGDSNPPRNDDDFGSRN